jgi:hypothetical protein
VIEESFALSLKDETTHEIDRLGTGVAYNIVGTATVSIFPTTVQEKLFGQSRRLSTKRQW